MAYMTFLFKENYDRANLMLPKCDKEIIKKAAVAEGERMNE